VWLKVNLESEFIAEEIELLVLDIFVLREQRLALDHRVLSVIQPWCA
jgi:hypothetical protein